MTLTPALLRCQSLVDPIGIDAQSPRLSWVCQTAAGTRRTIQTAYQIVVTQSGVEAPLWDSGKVKSGRSHHVAYEGSKLRSFQDLRWRVRLWDEHDQVSAYSEEARFVMGVLDDGAWAGSFIMYPVSGLPDAPFFRRALEIKKRVKRGWLLATGKGLVEPYLDGVRVTEDRFIPGWTDYPKRLHYRMFDVTERMKPGGHMLGAVLAEGWYRGQVGWDAAIVYGDRPQLLMNLRLEYEDGSVETIATDESWQTRTLEYQMASIMHGETVDARQRRPDWCQPANAAATQQGWHRPHTRALDAIEESLVYGKRLEQPPRLVAHPGVPVRKLAELAAISCHEVEAGTFVYDFGQNLAGGVCLRVRAPKGTLLRLRHGEMVNPDGTLYVENLRSARATDTYVCSGEEDTFEPRFSFHGFRYLELTGLPEALPLEALHAVVVGSDTPDAGRFECSSPMLNQLVSNIRWTMRANFLEVPTDCPQRDERLGWTGDAQVFIRTAIGNADVEAFFRKWLNDLADAQHASGGIANIVPTRKHSNEGDAAWADALTVCPTTLYRCYGDREQLAEWLPRMQAYLTHLDQAIGEDGVRQGPHCFGDWLALDGNMEEWWSGGATPKPLIQTAFYAYDCRLVAEALRELGEHALAETYTAKARATAEAFRRAFVDEEGRLKGDSQTGYVLALHFDLLPEELRAKALTHLCRNIETHERHLTTGFVGVSYLLPTLARFGRLDLAYTLLENETYPSWGYSIANGATTIWERWNGWKKAEGVGDANMNSYSHYAYGSVGEFLHATVAGLDVIEPGFRTARIAPKPGGSLTHASFAYDSIMGRYVAAWRKTESGYAYRIEVPANCRALCELPLGTAAMLVEGGVELPQVPGVSEVRVEDGVLHCELGSGSYSFEPVA